MKILLVGRGNMADAVAHECEDQKIECTRFLMGNISEISYDPNQYVMINFCSGRLLESMISLAEKTGMPLIQGSTNSKSREIMDDSKDVRIIYAPNLALSIVEFMKNFPRFAKNMMKFTKLTIYESHQKMKKDVSGTARFIASELEIPESEIVSIRDPEKQMEFGVPEEFLDGHAYHKYVFSGSGDDVEIWTKVHGRKTYAKGALVLAKGLNNLIARGDDNLVVKKVVSFPNLPDWIYLIKNGGETP